MALGLQHQTSSPRFHDPATLGVVPIVTRGAVDVNVIVIDKTGDHVTSEEGNFQSDTGVKPYQ